MVVISRHHIVTTGGGRPASCRHRNPVTGKPATMEQDIAQKITASIGFFFIAIFLSGDISFLISRKRHAARGFCPTRAWVFLSLFLLYIFAKFFFQTVRFLELCRSFSTWPKVLAGPVAVHVASRRWLNLPSRIALNSLRRWKSWNRPKTRHGWSRTYSFSLAGKNASTRISNVSGLAARPMLATTPE